jgi:pancreatic lipase-related protein 1
MSILKVVLLLVLAYQASCDKRFIYSDICYGDLGCYTNRPPFSSSLTRPIGVLPNAPEKIGSRFRLYSRNNALNGTSIQFNTTKGFNNMLETKIICHGFVHNGYKKWIMDMKDALLKLDDFNVIVVDWSKGNGFPVTTSIKA